MSLDNIKLPPLVIQYLFQKTLVSQPGNRENAATGTTTLNFLGGNNLNVVIVVNSSDVAYLTDVQLNFLTGILNACKLNMNDIAVVNLHQNKEINYRKLTTDLKAKVVLLFGLSPAEIDLPFTIPEFQIQSFNSQKYLSTPGLDSLQKDVELKKKLWTSLKQIFL